MEKLKSHKSFNGSTSFFEHQSSMTKTKMKFSIIEPQGEIKGAIIWLSGLTCTEENFVTKANAQKLASKLGVLIACPDTSPRGLDLPGEHDSYDFGSGAGFYVDATTKVYEENYKMYSYVNTEFYELINQTYNFDSNISIMGHSMGGHGALVIGLKNPEKYKSISAFSPITHPTESAWGQKAFTGYLGDNQSLWKSYDACELLKSGFKHKSLILVDQGTDDQFYPDQLLTNHLKEACASNNQNCSVNLREGFDHSYYFISSFIEDHINHHFKYLTNA